MNESSEACIEQQLKQQGAEAPRLSPEHIEQTMVDEAYYVFPNTMVTVCCLTLKNGFNVIGKSAAVSPANFNAEIGRKVARTKAREQIWELEGYLLKERLFEIAELIPASYETALPAEDDFWQTWASAIDLKPYLSIEIGYTRPTDWMVHIWNSEGVGLAKAPKIIMTQNTSRAEAMMEAAKQLRALFNLTA